MLCIAMVCDAMHIRRGTECALSSPCGDEIASLRVPDFCGTETLRDASRDLVEAFISTLAEEAAKDRAALICKLNGYNQHTEVES